MKDQRYEYTTLNEFIKELIELRDKHPEYGEYPICVNSVSPVFIDGKEYYYDGGYLVQEAGRPRSFLTSRLTDNKGRLSRRENIPLMCLTIESRSPDGDDENLINGRPARQWDPEGWEFLCQLEKEERETFSGQTVQYQGGVLTKKGLFFPYSCTQKSPEGDYVFKAYLDSGEFAYGDTMHKAKIALIELYSNTKREDKVK